MSLIVSGMLGLGDNVYQRPAVRALQKRRRTPLYVRTTWPQLYADMPMVRPVKAETDLRTQRHNAEHNLDSFVPAPPRANKIRAHYRVRDFQAGLTPSKAIAKQLNVSISGESFELPWDRSDIGRVAVVHPPTVRTEWMNGARPNDSSYMQRLIDNHPEFTWVSLGWLDGAREMLYGQPLRVDEEYMNGELSTEEMITLIASARVFVTCVGFGLPLGIALRQKTLVMYGGDVPPRLLREKWMGLDNLEEVVPHPFCECFASRHNDGRCNKVLDDQEVEEKFGLLVAEEDHARVA